MPLPPKGERRRGKMAKLRKATSLSTLRKLNRQISLAEANFPKLPGGSGESTHAAPPSHAAELRTFVEVRRRCLRKRARGFSGQTTEREGDMIEKLI